MWFQKACTKTRNTETKPPERNHRNHRNETTETTGTTKTKPPEIQLKGVTYRLWRVFSVKIQNLISNAGIGGKNYRLSPGRGNELKLWQRKEPADDMWLLLTVFPGDFVSVVLVVSFWLFRWFRWLWWFRSGGFVSVFRVLVHAVPENIHIPPHGWSMEIPRGRGGC